MMKLQCFALCFAAMPLAAAASLDLLIEHLRKQVEPQRPLGWVRAIHASDRFFTFPRFQATNQYLSRVMREIGLEQVEVIQAPADGVTQVGFWTMPMAWDVTSARLQVLGGDGLVLADYPDVPASLGMWSGPTPPEGVEAEVVSVSKSDLRGAVDLRGKLALMEVNPAGHKAWLVKNGALGAINAFTENPALEDGRQWINAWGDSGWAFTKASTPLLSFSISPRQSAKLRQLLERGPVRVRATVKSRYYSGTYPYVTGVVRGTGPEEVMVLAHTSEQGAHDNATGASAALEALRSIESLIRARKLTRPQRSIRVLLMPEMYGSMHYVQSNAERVRRTIAGLCLDTPAAAYELPGTEYTFHVNPHVASSFTDALMMKTASSYFPLVKRTWHERAFVTGTDTYLAEPMVEIPTLWPYAGSGVETHHNSEDTPDRVDQRSLRDLSIVSAAFLYSVANAGEAEASWLAELSESRGQERILKSASDFLSRVESSKTSTELAALVNKAQEQLAYIGDRQRQAVSSVLRLVAPHKRKTVELELQPALGRLARLSAQQSGRVQEAALQRLKVLGLSWQLEAVPAVRPGEAEAAKIVVRRKRFGTIPLDDLPVEKWEGQPSGAWSLRPTIALYWCDGKRSLAEVVRLTELELGESQFDYVTYFRFLRKNGYVDFVD